MDFLKLWKNYPVLWYDSPTDTDTVYVDAVSDLTNEINNKRNLTITNLGMIITLRRIRSWFRHFKSDDRISDDGQNLYNPEYYGKCSEFLSKHETRTVTCDKCHHLFTDEAHLQSHVANKHQTFCDICQKDFGRPFVYRKHAVIHEPPKLECNICGKKYHYLEIYRNHMRAHRNERNYVCEKCGKAFVRQQNLKDHTLQKHSDKDNPATMHKKQPCAICNIDFKNWSELSFHRRKNHLVLEGTIEQLQCKVPRKMRKHAWALDPVTHERRLPCDFCDKTYARYGGLYRHMGKEHGYKRQIDVKKAVQLKSNTAHTCTETVQKPTSIKMSTEDTANLKTMTEEDAGQDDTDYI